MKILAYLKTHLYILFFFPLVFGITHLLEYKNMWRTGHSVKKIPHSCYVGIRIHSQPKFVIFKELNRMKDFSFIKKNMTLKNSIDSDKWQLIKKGNVITVNWSGDDRGGVFNYKINNDSLTPISCKDSNVAFMFRGLAYSAILISISRIVFQRIKKFRRKKRKSKQYPC